MKIISKIKNFLFNNHSVRQTVAKNTFWMAAGQIGSRLFRALIVIYAARILGAASYGVFSYVVGLAGFFTVLTDLGVKSTLTREVSQKPEKADSYFATAFWIKMGLLVITALLIIFVAPLFSRIEAAKALIPFVALLTTFDALREFSSAYFRGKEKMELDALLIIVANVSITIFGFVILTIFPTAKALTMTYILSAGTGALLGVYILKDKFVKVFKYFRKKLVKPILKASLPIAFLGILGVFMLNIDIVMLGFYEGAKEIGFYSASQKIVNLLYVIPSILAISTFPTISKFISKKNKKKTRELFEKSLTSSLLVAFPLAAGGAVVGDQLITFIYGAEYLPSASAFFFLILTPLLVFPGMFIGNYIFAHDKQKKIAPMVVAGAVINIVLNALLIPVWGIVGCALATIGAQIVYNGAILWLAKKIDHFEILRYLPNVLVGTLAMGVAILILKLLGIHVLINIFLGIGIYFLVLYLLGEETLGEIKKSFSGIK
ncbi:MAG TPA: flippase [Candidatus Paceibacterota bacterium]|nr:flippase [Candidatus Paceibacterota bacterium]